MEKRPDIQRIIADREIRSLFQPIVGLASGQIVGYEALARGPAGSALERPDAMFGAARDAGLIVELDWACQAAALERALVTRLDTHTRLFINVDPESLAHPLPDPLDELYQKAATRFAVVIEVTERKLDSDPSAVIHRVAALRERGFAVALDDVGADPMSLAFLPLLAPDVIKLDMGLIQDPHRNSFAEVGAAVSADAESRGAMILGEGIETQEHVLRAAVLGATLGQEWLFGRPRDLPDQLVGGPTADSHMVTPRLETPETPWSLVATDRPTIAPKRLLLPISRHIEQMAHSGNDRPVVLGAFQQARYFTPATAKRYERLASVSSFVAAVGSGMATQPAPGVRGADIDDNARLADEWVALTLSPHRAAAIIGKDLGDDGPDAERRFAYVVTHDRATVGAAARSMMQYLAPRR